MREFAKFGTGFWTSPAIQALSDNGKLLAAYLISGPHSNQAGVFRMPNGYVQGDLGWSDERVSKGFAELSANGFAHRCETTFWVVLPKALKHTPPENPNQAKHVRALIEQLPSNATIRTVVAQCLSEFWVGVPADLIQWLGKPLRNPSETVSQQREGEREGDKKEKEREKVAPSANALVTGDAPKGTNGSKAFTDGPIAISIPLVGDGEYAVHQSLVDELDRSYPAVDAMQTLREIRSWNLTHPRQRKTERGVLAHINTWFAKEQNRG